MPEDWVTAAEEGSRVASLALLHGHVGNGARLQVYVAIELETYCDDSGTPQHDFCIGGYLAPAAAWRDFERRWTNALRQANLSEFHMRDCEQNDGEFKDRSDRIALQERFIDLIASADVAGFAVHIDLRAFLAVQQVFKANMRQGYHKAYLQAFVMELQFILSKASHFPADERISFIFDQQDEFIGRATEIYSRARKDRAFPGRERLGPITFADSKYVAPLQAADLLAYEIHRQHRNGIPPGPNVKVRWQSARLSKNVHVAFLAEDEIRKWAATYQESG